MVKVEIKEEELDVVEKLGKLLFTQCCARSWLSSFRGLHLG